MKEGAGERTARWAKGVCTLGDEQSGRNILELRLSLPTTTKSPTLQPSMAGAPSIHIPPASDELWVWARAYTLPSLNTQVLTRLRHGLRDFAHDEEKSERTPGGPPVDLFAANAAASHVTVSVDELGEVRWPGKRGGEVGAAVASC